MDRLGGEKEVQQVSDFIDAVIANNFNQADLIIKDYRLDIKAKFYLIGRIIVGDNVPNKWNSYIQHALFVNEKPYFD